MIKSNMFEDHQKFLAWAAAYDCGDIIVNDINIFYLLFRYPLVK